MCTYSHTLVKDVVDRLNYQDVSVSGQQSITFYNSLKMIYGTCTAQRGFTVQLCVFSPCFTGICLWLL